MTDPLEITCGSTQD